MPQVARHYCTRCGQSIYNCVIDGVRVPLLAYLVVGQPADTGPTIDLNAPGVKVPSFVRTMLAADTPRVEFCMQCLADVLGQPLIEWSLDPALDAEGNVVGVPDRAAANRDEMGEVAYARQMHAPTMAALVRGRTPQAVRATPLVAPVAADKSAAPAVVDAPSIEGA
jgi:hypothetical protein